MVDDLFAIMMIIRVVLSVLLLEEKRWYFCERTRHAPARPWSVVGWVKDPVSLLCCLRLFRFTLKHRIHSNLLSSFHHVANKEDKRLESSYSGRTVVLF